jgi:hypothetical protein
MVDVAKKQGFKPALVYFLDSHHPLNTRKKLFFYNFFQSGKILVEISPQLCDNRASSFSLHCITFQS